MTNQGMPNLPYMAFDNELYRYTGYGPRRTQGENVAKFSKLKGYNRDPLWQFPALRSLMPNFTTVITSTGTVQYGRLKFRSKILKFFVGDQVNIILSPGWQRSAWVYTLDHEIIDDIHA